MDGPQAPSLGDWKHEQIRIASKSSWINHSSRKDRTISTVDGLDSKAHWRCLGAVVNTGLQFKRELELETDTESPEWMKLSPR